MPITTRTEDVSGDGGVMEIYVAEPRQVGAGTCPVVIVFMEAFGVNGHIKEVTDRFANEGYLAIAPDMYYRNGKGIVVGYNEIPKVMPLMQSMNDVQTNADTRIAIDFAKGLEKARADRIGCVGYCMGGTLSWMAACLNRDIKAASVYYTGGLITRETSARRPLSPHEYASLLTAPVLGNFGQDDQNPTPADVQQVDAELSKLWKVHDFKIYPGAGHGFSCNDRPSYHQASADDAWARTLAWFGKYLKG
ncbi:MAG: dienelactone hydrolase family protein [Dehalococcoidia bacterium]